MTEYEKIHINLDLLKQSIANLKEIIEDEEIHSKFINRMIYTSLLGHFNVTFELICKVAKRLIEFNSTDGSKLIGSKDIFRAALTINLVEDNAVWFEMINIRNKVVHEYLLQELDELAHDIKTNYFFEFEKLEKNLRTLYEQNKS
jgi:nucleotidyltransferase substrate binding protein (TIGR01987 family)